MLSFTIGRSVSLDRKFISRESPISRVPLARRFTGARRGSSCDSAIALSGDQTVLWFLWDVKYTLLSL